MLEILQQISLVQWAATLFSLVYVGFAVKNNPICWVFGIIGCGLWAYADFTELNLKFDGLLQIFYVVIGFVGLYQWKFGNQGGSLPIRTYKWQQHVIILLTGLAISFFFGWIGQQYLDTSLAYLDAITTAFSVVATILLVRRIIDNWLYWIVFNSIYVYIYGRQGAYLFVGIMLIYTVMAVLGYVQWRKKLRALNKTMTNK